MTTILPIESETMPMINEHDHATSRGHGITSCCRPTKPKLWWGYPIFLLAVSVLVGLCLPNEFRALSSSDYMPSTTLRASQLAVTQDDSWKEEQQLISDPDPQQPQLSIAWLMSFPNSGTSYTSKMIRHATQTRSASNYGDENVDGTGASKPVYADQPQGPFWSEPSIHPDYTLPQKVVLTKTHCGGRCEFCPPHKYVETTYSFRQRCLYGKRVVPDLNKKNATKLVYDHYPSYRVRKAVHLIRDPFDNVVSRFHLERHGHSAEGFPSTREGFRNYCQELNEHYALLEQRTQWLDEDILETLKNVPCHADFLRYLEWHNLAFVTAADLHLDTMVVHYDWYETSFNQTVTELLDFLELEQRAEPEPFELGKVYHDYYTPEERAAVHQAFEVMALKVTWKNIARYFED